MNGPRSPWWPWYFGRWKLSLWDCSCTNSQYPGAWNRCPTKPPAHLVSTFFLMKERKKEKPLRIWHVEYIYERITLKKKTILQLCVWELHLPHPPFYWINLWVEKKMNLCNFPGSEYFSLLYFMSATLFFLACIYISLCLLSGRTPS